MSKSFRAARAQVHIHASAARIWAVMLDVQRYGDWNPFVFRIDGATRPVAVGSKFTLRVRWATGGVVSSDEVVTRLDPPAPDANGTVTANWTYRYTSLPARLGVLHADRTQTLEEQADGTTIYATEERFHGILRHFVPLAHVQSGFDVHAAALKAAAEAAVGPPAGAA